MRQIPAEPAQLVNAPSADIIFVDARVDLVGAKSLCKILNTTGLDAPLLLVVTEGGLTAVSTDWGIDDVILVTAGPAEVDARIRLAIVAGVAGEDTLDSRCVGRARDRTPVAKYSADLNRLRRGSTEF